MIRIPRESIEFVKLDVTVDGSPVTAGIEVSVTSSTSRPTLWQPATILEGKAGLMTGTYPLGLFNVWVRVTDNPEVPVLQAGQLSIY